MFMVESTGYSAYKSRRMLFILVSRGVVLKATRLKKPAIK